MCLNLTPLKSNENFDEITLGFGIQILNPVFFDPVEKRFRDVREKRTHKIARGHSYTAPSEPLLFTKVMGSINFICRSPHFND